MDLLEPLARAHGRRARGLRPAAHHRHLARTAPSGCCCTPGTRGRMFLLEFGVGVVLPVGLLLVERIRTNPTGLVARRCCAVLGFVMNRLNVSVTGMERASGRALRAVVDGDHGVGRARGARLRGVRARGALPADLPRARRVGGTVERVAHAHRAADRRRRRARHGRPPSGSSRRSPCAPTAAR